MSNLDLIMGQRMLAYLRQAPNYSPKDINFVDDA